ncbi:MAG: HD domain-containing protein [Clostridiales bacterium]|nr:HD domain-containing protein [Clostridiales bacterium]
MTIKLPDAVQYILHTLQAAGYDAYVVGGCVRDGALGKAPKDWDICTPAPPNKTMQCFDGQHIIETGLQHGTVTLMLHHAPYEITTYRVDGSYSDHRRPDNVEFVSSLKTDLSRRDFTINAMAYHPDTGIVDYFGGMKDISAGIIRCVGDANRRFREDALRIMRAMRFASALSFAIDEKTATAMHDNRALLQNIAVERIANELNRMLLGDGAGDIMRNHLSVLAEILPELVPTIGLSHNNPYHSHDVLNHILCSVEHAPKEPVIRLTMLFHDLGKPYCYTEEDGIGHFYGHPKVSAELAEAILARLKYDNETKRAVTELVLYHDAPMLPDRKHIKRWLCRIGEERFRQLIEVKRADALAQSVLGRREKLDTLDAIAKLADEIVAQQECFSLKDLAVNGNDLLSLGFTAGAALGEMLNRLMDMVIDEQVKNDKAALLTFAAKNK